MALRAGWDKGHPHITPCYITLCYKTMLRNPAGNATPGSLHGAYLAL